MKTDGEGQEAFKLLVRLANKSRRMTSPDLALTDRLLRRGLVERTIASGLTLTETGVAFVRRGLADPDGFVRQHRDRCETVIDDPSGRRKVVVNRNESPLMRLRHQRGRDGKPLLDAAEFAAGERLRADYDKAQLMPRVTANWSAAIASRRRDGGRGGMADLSETALAARQRVDRALGAVGPEFAGVLVDFCCFLKGIAEIEKTRGWPARSAKLVLRLALSCLARHYGLTATGHGTRRGGKLRHWGAEDYRPNTK